MICEASTQVVGKAEAARKPEAQPTTWFVFGGAGPVLATGKGEGLGGLAYALSVGWQVIWREGGGVYHRCRGPRRKCEG